MLVISFTPRQLWPRGKTPGIHSLGGWMRPNHLGLGPKTRIPLHSRNLTQSSRVQSIILTELSPLAGVDERIILRLILRAGRAQSVYRWATGWTAGVRSQAQASYFPLLHNIQIGSGAHQTSYPLGTGDSFPEGKVAGAWSWPLTSIQCRGQDWWSYTSTPSYVFTAWCLID
jgi:hypothetical protein